MLSNIIEPGCKIDLKRLERREEKEPAEEKIYHSQVYEILSEDTMEIIMPMEQTKLILLPMDKEYEVTFYVGKALYQCLIRIVDRYKSNNIYLLSVEMTSSLRRKQRREYYRYSCAIEIQARALEDIEVRQVVDRKPLQLLPDMVMKAGIIVDISGGGLRFMSAEKFAKDTLVYCSFTLNIANQRKLYEIIGIMLSVQEVPNRKDVYEHRIKFVILPVNEREEIIKFIFEEERKNRRKERGE